VLTLPLLVGIDGVEKMGKSLGNFVAITEPAAEQFGKLMRIPDSVVQQYASLCTTLHPSEVSRIGAEVAAGGAPANQAKRRVAREIVTLYHGAQAAAAAEDRFNAIFRDHQLPTDAPAFSTRLPDPVHLPALLTAAGLADSSSAARRLIDAGAVKVDGTPVARGGYELPAADLAGRLLAVGKRKVVRILAEAD
jgi:tyrosyl-tRNA synthetase